MPKVSVMLLTKDRPDFLKRSLESIRKQTFTDFELVLMNAGTDKVSQKLIDAEVVKGDTRVVSMPGAAGVTRCRQAVLEVCKGEYVAPLDDDDEWVPADKLAKQVAFMDSHPDVVVAGGGIHVVPHPHHPHIYKPGPHNTVFRPELDADIRRTMLLRNNLFTSTILFRREPAVRVGGFIWKAYETSEDYDILLRLGTVGKFYNFQEVFANYSQPNYSKERFVHFLKKQLLLISEHRYDYPGYWLAYLFLHFRVLLKR